MTDAKRKDAAYQGRAESSEERVDRESSAVDGTQSTLRDHQVQKELRGG